MGQLLLSSLPMFVSGFWALLLLCCQLEKYSRTRIVLAMFMINTALLYYAHCVFFNEFYSMIPASDTIYTFATLATYPMLYIFLVSMTSNASQVKKAWILLLPAFILSVTVGVLYSMMSEQETKEFVKQCLYDEQFFGHTGIYHHMAITHLVIKIVFAITVISVLVAGMNKLVKYEHQIKSVYSNVEGKTLISFKIFLYLFCFSSMASFIFNIVGRYNFDTTFWVLTLPSIVFSILIFILGLLGLRQSFTYESMDAELQETPPQPVGAENDNLHSEMLAQRIESVIEEKQLFRLPNLKVSDLAAQLCTNRLYISQAINSVMHISFSDYINKKRIEHAAKLISENPNMPIADVAYESGFASQNSFYRNFKNFKGCSPKVYMRLGRKA
ncbi:MAG: helix-turn-helix domain-containing protein [Bacteroidales bacterium]|nr:helix-turn-helix domain-containing protein [Bacteroidales bacterium]